MTIKSLSAQDYPYDLPYHDFINYKENTLIFPGDSIAFNSFFKKMDELIFRGNGKINIVHMGGSHVQADIVSGRLRERLQTFYPGNKGSRGLVFPFRVAGTNNPYNYFVNYTGTWTNCRCVRKEDINCSMGLTGISISTKDTTSSIHINLRTDYYQVYDFNRIRIFHNKDSLQFHVFPEGIDTSLYIIKTDFNKGITDIYLNDYHTEIKLLFQPKDSLHVNGYTLYGIQLENDDPGITYHSIGVNGAATYSYLRCNLLEDHLNEIHPDLVIFGIGINDAAGKSFDPNTFELNYKSLIQKVRNKNPDCPILFLTNNDSFYRYRRKYYVNKNGELVRTSMLKLARENNAAVWDFFTIMGGLSSMKKWEDQGLAKKDKVHFTSTGYKLMGDLLFNALLSEYEKHVYNIYKTTEK